MIRTAEGMYALGHAMASPDHDPGTERKAVPSLMVELLSCHMTLPDRAWLASYRSGGRVKVFKYNQALQALSVIV